MPDASFGQVIGKGNSFYSNSCSVKSAEYLKLIFISLSSPLVALERDIFILTKGCLMSEKIKPE